jgi:hypothetical protein
MNRRSLFVALALAAAAASQASLAAQKTVTLSVPSGCSACPITVEALGRLLA